MFLNVGIQFFFLHFLKGVVPITPPVNTSFLSSSFLKGRNSVNFAHGNVSSALVILPFSSVEVFKNFDKF
jgi:hypothetical protein